MYKFSLARLVQDNNSANNKHRVEDFVSPDELPPYVEIYTWQSCTLRELSHLLTSAYPDLLPSPAIGTRLSFRLIFPDTHIRGANSASGPPKYMTKELGSVVIGDGGTGILPGEDSEGIVSGGPMEGAMLGEPEKSLAEARFVIGDYVACAIIEPLQSGAVAPPPPSGPARGGFGAGRGAGEFGGGRARENGFGGGGGGGFRGFSGRGAANFGQGFVPNGEWRRGERVPEGPASRGRGFGAGFGGRGGRY